MIRKINDEIIMMVIMIKMIFSVTSEKKCLKLVMDQKASEIHVLWVP